MIDPNINPHEGAVEELLKWEKQGVRHTFDPELVVLADLKIYDKIEEQK